MASVIGLYNYWIYVALMMVGFYAVIAKTNLLKNIFGLGIFQTAVFLLYISMAMVDGGTAPILWEKAKIYVNPLPHVLILTAIVVAVSTMAVALALIIRIRDAYGTIEADDIEAMEKDDDR